MRRDRANGYIIDTEQKTLSIAVVPLAYARELPAAERMERMRYPHKTRGCDRITCISNGVTSGWRKVPTRCRSATPTEKRREITAAEFGALLSGIDLSHAKRSESDMPA